MKTNVSQKIKTGIFTLAGIIVLVIGIFIIGEKKNLFSSTYSIYGTFKNVGGLQIGNNIRFAGINIGTVDDIEIINDTTIRVDMRLKSKVKRFIKKDALAAISSDGLMGDKLITITPGTDKMKLLGKGDRILTVDPIEMSRIITKLSQVADNAADITGALAGIVLQVQQGKGSLGRLLYSDEMAKGMEKSVNIANQTMQSVKKSSEGFSENMDALKHNALLHGYYKKKKRDELRKQAAIEKNNIKNDSTRTKKRR